ALADVAEDGGVDGEVLGDADGAFGQAQPGADERVGAGLHAAARLARATTLATHATEERLEDVTEAAETGAAESRTAAAVFERVAAQVDDPALLRVGEHLVRGGDFLELGLGGL